VNLLCAPGLRFIAGPEGSAMSVNDVGGGGKAGGEMRQRGGLRMRFSTQAAELWKTFVLTPLRCPWH
jgi:hypothetical protein